MKFNGYLRLFEIDMNILMDRMANSSKLLFEDFKNKRKSDAWKCPQCLSLLAEDSKKWKCDRCLFWHHEKCAKAKQVKRPAKPDALLCTSCFFVL